MFVTDISRYKIRKAMQKAGYDLYSLAEAADIPYTTLQDIASGQHDDISLYHICKMARAFDMPAAEFIDRMSIAKDTFLD